MRLAIGAEGVPVRSGSAVSVLLCCCPSHCAHASFRAAHTARATHDAMAAREDDRELEKALLPGDEAAHDADDSYGRGAQSTASASGDGGRPPVGVLYAASLIATWMAISCVGRLERPLTA